MLRCYVLKVDVDYHLLQDRYSSLSDEELMEIAINGDLRYSAKIAMQAELKLRKIGEEILSNRATELEAEAKAFEAIDNRQRSFHQVILLLVTTLLPAVIALAIAFMDE